MLKAIVVGSGGIGSVTALALEYTGKCQVTVVARSMYDHVKQHGWSFESVDYGNFNNWYPSEIASSVEVAAKSGPYDFVIVATKCIPEVQRTEDIIRPLVNPGCAIVVIQNGVGNEEPIMTAFPESYVIGGVTLMGSANHGGCVAQTLTDKVDFGTLDKRPQAIEKTQEFVNLYNLSRGKASLHKDIAYRRWCKLVYNATFNPICALTGLDSGRVIFSGLLESIVKPAMYEIRLIAETETGKKLPDNIEKEMIDSDAGTYYEPSMLVDAKKGQLMELELLVGNPLRYAAKNGLDTPTLRSIYTMLRGKQFATLEKYGKFKLPPEPFNVELAHNLMGQFPWEI